MAIRCLDGAHVQGHQLQGYIQRTIGAGNMYEAVKLPPGEDINEWMAVNTVDFYNAISLMYSTLEDFCTRHTCEKMLATNKVG